MIIKEVLTPESTGLATREEIVQMLVDRQPNAKAKAWIQQCADYATDCWPVIETPYEDGTQVGFRQIRWQKMETKKKPKEQPDPTQMWDDPDTCAICGKPLGDVCYRCEITAHHMHPDCFVGMMRCLEEASAIANIGRPFDSGKAAKNALRFKERAYERMSKRPASLITAMVTFTARSWEYTMKNTRDHLIDISGGTW